MPSVWGYIIKPALLGVAVFTIGLMVIVLLFSPN